MLRIPDRIRVEFAVRTPVAALVLIVLFGLALRVTYHCGLHSGDDGYYAQLAHNLVSKGQFVHTDVLGFRIGTWWPAALGFRLFGVNGWGLTAFPMAMSLVSIVVVYLLGKRLFDEGTGLAAAFLYSFYPLNVELSTRLLPDSLLSSFSLLAVYLLYSADLANQETEGDGLRKPHLYLLSGVLLGGCLAVNMSVSVIAPYLAAYFCVSAWNFRRRSVAGLGPGLLQTCWLRGALLIGGVLLVAVPEAVVYAWSLGDPLMKYTGTLAHYNAEGRVFHQNLWFYPEYTFFLGKGWNYHLPEPAYRYYGFFFLMTLPALVWGAYRKRTRFGLVAFWFLAVALYLQWGSMGFETYNPLHRLYRHLELATPPMILCLAFALRNVRPGWPRAVAGWTVMPFLLISSLQVIHCRHQALRSELLFMEPVRAAVDLFQPTYLITDDYTHSYLRFLERYRPKRRCPLPIEGALHYAQPDGLVVMHGRQHGEGGPDRERYQPPPRHWVLAHQLWRPNPFTGRGEYLRLYRFTKHPRILRRIEERHPGALNASAVLLFSCEDLRVADSARVVLRNLQAEFGREGRLSTEGASWHFYRQIPGDSPWTFKVLKDKGRGEVRMVERPTVENDYALTVLLDDAEFPGEDTYTFYVLGYFPGIADPGLRYRLD